MVNEWASMDSRFPTIPPTKEDYEDLLAVDRQTKDDVRLRHHLYVNADWDCNTVTYVLVKSLIGLLKIHIMKNGVDVLADSEDNSINFYDLIEIIASNKKNERAEKIGNINISFVVGSAAHAIIEDDTVDTKQAEYVELKSWYSQLGDSNVVAAMKKVDTIARRQLKDERSIIMTADWSAVGISVIFIENLFRHLIAKLVASDKNSVMINFNDIIEVHAMRTSDNGVMVKLRPGMGAKLIIKSDQSTEAEDDDE